MSEKKYQVFISSTYKDLIEERRDIARAVLDLGHIPAAMEHFPAMDEEQLTYIQRIIDECDYYVLVIAGKYGSQDSSGISYTEREYDYALSKGKVVLGFPIKNMAALRRDQTEEDPQIAVKLEAFRQKLMSGRLIRTWEDRKDLELAVVKSLPAAFQRIPQEGWVRTPKNSNEHLLEEINELRKENTRLRDEVESTNKNPEILIQDLAGMDDNYTINIKYFAFMDEHSFGENTQISWRQIFLYYAGSIKQVGKSGDIRSKFVDRIVEIHLKHDGNSIYNYSISDHQYSVIGAQLAVLGLIAEDDEGFNIVTQGGKNIYLTSIAIRKT